MIALFIGRSSSRTTHTQLLKCEARAITFPRVTRVTSRDLTSNMTALTSKQRAHLRKLAHRMKPVVLVGGDGVSEALVVAVGDAFNTRELLKIKLQEAAPLGIREAADLITRGIPNSHAVQTIGKTAVLYRPDPEDPDIRLPAASV
jgi:RNA-binding protein